MGFLSATDIKAWATGSITDNAFFFFPKEKVVTVRNPSVGVEGFKCSGK